MCIYKYTNRLWNLWLCHSTHICMRRSRNNLTDSTPLPKHLLCFIQKYKNYVTPLPKHILCLIQKYKNYVGERFWLDGIHFFFIKSMSKESKCFALSKNIKNKFGKQLWNFEIFGNFRKSHTFNFVYLPFSTFLSTKMGYIKDATF